MTKIVPFCDRTFHRHNWKVPPAAVYLWQEDHHDTSPTAAEASPHTSPAAATAHTGDATRRSTANSTATSDSGDATGGMRRTGGPDTPRRTPHWGCRSQVSASQVLRIAVLCEYLHVYRFVLLFPSPPHIFFFRLSTCTLFLSSSYFIPFIFLLIGIVLLFLLNIILRRFSPFSRTLSFSSFPILALLCCLHIHLFVLLPSFYPSLFMLCFTFISSFLFRIFPPLLFSFKIIVIRNITEESPVDGSNSQLGQIQVNIYKSDALLLQSVWLVHPGISGKIILKLTLKK
jgi:hypothetical protein